MSPAGAATYYVSENGSDSMDGRSERNAWKTLQRVNQFNFSPADSLQFKAGDTFNGTIRFSLTNYPSLISSYGKGKAVINSGNEAGIYLVNTSGITITKLIVNGAGYMATSRLTNGIDFRCLSPLNASLQNITIDSVEVYGYGGDGISFNVGDSVYGFNNVTITNCNLHDNGMSGLTVNGYYDSVNNLFRYSNSHVYVGYTVAFNNYGRSEFKQNWSGTGVLIAGTENGLIEYCVAYENGRENGSFEGGPIGIWTDDSKYVIIQYCVSHHNRSGPSKKDGGGFDIDGGCYGCVIQYCESYENEGAGYGLFQWETGNQWSNDTIRYNNSFNDGRNEGYGAVTFWGVDSLHPVTNAQVYGNTIKLNKKGAALFFIGKNFENIQVHDNNFCIEHPAVYTPSIPVKVAITNSNINCDATGFIDGLPMNSIAGKQQ